MKGGLKDFYKIPEVHARMYLQEVHAIASAEPIRNTGDAGRILREQFADADREYFVSVNLDAKGRPISYHVAGIGSVCSVHFAIDSVFKIALLQNSVSILVCHNHPGGTLAPSNDDLEATKSLVAVGNLLGIRVLDHLIISPDDYVSLREGYGEVFQ